MIFFLQCHGTRPTDKDFETLYNLEKGDTLANIYKDFKTFEGDLDRILAFLNKEFGLNMVRKVIKHHETLNKEILEKILKTTITLGLFLYKDLGYPLFGSGVLWKFYPLIWIGLFFS